MPNTKKKILRGAGAALILLVAAVAALAAFVEIDGIPRYAARPPELHVEATPARVAHGKKLVSLLCAGCHQGTDGVHLTGQRIADLPPQFGEIVSKNITRHPDKGIGRWTDGEIAYFLRTGVRPDGQYVPGWMIKLPHASDEDIASIVAFLRSDDPSVAPSDADPPGKTRPSFLSKALAHGVFGPLPYPEKPIVAPPRSDRVAYGRYLVFNLDCFSCHSPDFLKVDALHPESTPGYMSGGNPLGDGRGGIVPSRNLTPDPETGIGRWSEAEFVRAVKGGFRPDGKALRYPMLPRAELDDDEAGAIWAYLRTIPAIRRDVPRPAEPVADGAGEPGKRLYESYGCAGCHGPDGAGLGGGADIRHTRERFATDAALRAWIEDAPSIKPGTRMPKWKGVIRDEDYDPLVRYVRALGKEPRRTARN